MQSVEITIISAQNSQRLEQLFRDLWRYRDVALALIERDIWVRYKQTVLGVLWVVLQPLLAAGLFAFIFGRVLGMSTGGLPHFLFYIVGLVPWMCFAGGLTQSALGLTSDANLVSKVYFPRILVPLAYVLGTVPDFLIAFAAVNGIALWLGQWHPAFVLICPILLLIQLLFVLGVGSALAVLNAQYRDVKYVLPFLVQMGLLVTPIIYPADLLPSWAAWLQHANPMAAVVESYRAALAGSGLPVKLLMTGAVWSVGYAFIGLGFFQARERRLADVL